MEQSEQVDQMEQMGQKEQSEHKKTDVLFDAPFESKISRLFIFRFLWIYIEMWVLMVWNLWFGLVVFAHFWYMLVLGKRSESLWKKQLRYMRHLSKWQGYLMNLTDRRPDFIEK